MPQPPTVNRTCNACGDQLQPESLPGLCPRCLLQIGIDGGTQGQLHIRCPQCQVAIEIVDDATMHEVTCPSCDSRFSLIGDLAATLPADAPRALGRFQLLDRVGIGAFGSVWKARDPELDRIVAVKIPRKEQLSADEAEQFLREARSAGQLKHPGIVSVHEVGHDGDRIYIVSDFIPGVTLADRLSAGRPSIRESAEICRLVAEALQHAHDNGVIHRDLKPSNIMLDDLGQPHVMDFGLAKREGAEVTMTIDGRILGTPAYMSPEQARGDGHHADARSDIYSLGVVLFELLTGEKPFRGTSQMLLHQVLKEDAPSPRTLNGAVPRDVETICLKCLEKDPERRFDSARHLADEFDRFLQSQPIHSRPITRMQRGWRWCVRNPVVATLTTAVALSLLVGLTTTLWQWRIAQNNLSEATQARGIAELRQGETAAALVQSQSRLARVFVERGLQKVDVDPHAGLPWLVQALKTESAGSDAHQMHRLRLGLLLRELPTLLGFWPNATDARFSADGSKLAVATANQIRLFEFPELRPIPVIQLDEPFTSMTFTRTGDRLATVSRTTGGPPWCRIWDTATGKPVTKKLDLTEREYNMRETPIIHFTPVGERFVATYAGMYNRWHTKTVARVFDSLTLEQVAPTFAHHSDLDYTNGYHQLSPDALRLLVSRGVPGDDPKVDWNDPKFPAGMNRPQQYDLRTGKPMHPPLDHPLDFYGKPVYSDDGGMIATSDEGVTKIWNAIDGSLINEFPLSPEVKYASLRFHPDGRSLFIIEKRKAFWREIAAGELKREWTHDDKFFVDPTARYCVRRDPNGVDYIEDITSGNPKEQRLPELYRVEFSPDGSHFLLKPKGYSEAGLHVSPPHLVIRSADAVSITPPWRFSSSEIGQPFSQNGRHFLTKFDTGIWLWDLQDRQQVVQEFPSNRSGDIIDADSSRDRRRCVVLTSDLNVSCWDTESGQPLYSPFRIEPPSSSDPNSKWHFMSLSDAGDNVAIVGEYRPQPEDSGRSVHLVQVWNLKTGQRRFDPLVFDQPPNSWVAAARFLDRRQQLVVVQHLHHRKQDTNDSGHDKTRIHVLNPDTGTPFREPVDFDHTLRILDFTPDQSRCLVQREDARWPVTSRNPDFATAFVQMFDTQSWQPVSPRMTPTNGVAWNAKLSPKGTRIAMGNAEVWDVDRGERLHAALVEHRSVGEIVFGDDGNTFIAVTDGGRNDWDPPAEVRAFTSDGESMCAPMMNVRTGSLHCAIHPRDSIIAVAGSGLRLWDARQGTALSGVYDLHASGATGRVENKDRSTFFDPSGQNLYIEASEKMLIVRWNTVVENVPGDDVLAAWSGMLSGTRIDNAGGIVPMTATEFDAAWQIIQKGSPIVSPAE